MTDILGVKLGACLSLTLTAHEITVLLLQHRCGGEKPFHTPRLSVWMCQSVFTTKAGCSEVILEVCVSHMPCSNQLLVQDEARCASLTKPVCTSESQKSCEQT